MRLKPNDVLQEGDIIHYKKSATTHTVRGGLCGDPALDADDLTSPTGRDYVERPDPEPDLREHVRILREALGKCAGLVNHTEDWFAIAPIINSALEQTK